MAGEWRRLLGQHPGVMQLLAERHKPLESLAAFRPMETALEVFRRAGLPPREAAQAFNAFGGYLMGFVMMEQGLMPGQARKELDHDHGPIVEALEAAGLPNVVECFQYFTECPTDEQFEFGLDLLIRGLMSRPC
jgi:hypothetical protein